MARTNPGFERITIALAGVLGGGGVMAAAGAAHGGAGSNLGSIAMVCLAHGPALLALGLAGPRGRLFAAAAILLGLGTLVFAGDLLARQYLGRAAFPLAAPLGGMGMIAGWIAVIAAGLWSQSQAAQ
ncbi:DUF423 domain-containing protein [uncultured Devosia sp.]|uniref:DUF423 domain-containing protein n=1 Tax=uncultured Devosia sp. TaxID=211434 RepID=UPI0035CC2E5F